MAMKTCYILTFDRAVNQEMHLCKKQVDIRQLYHQLPQTAWVSSSGSLSQLGDKMPARESACRLRVCGPQWPTVEQPQPRWGRSAAMVRRTLGQYVAVSNSPLTPNPFENKVCEREIFIKKCVRSFIEVVMIVDYVSVYICIMYMAIQKTHSPFL